MNKLLGRIFSQNDEGDYDKIAYNIHLALEKPYQIMVLFIDIKQCYAIQKTYANVTQYQQKGY